MAEGRGIKPDVVYRINSSGELELRNRSTGAVIATFTTSGMTLTAGEIVTADLADDAVTAAKIADGVIANVAISASAAIARSKLEQNALAIYKVPLTDFLAEDGAELGITEDSADLYRALASNVVSLFGRTPETATEAAAATCQIALPAEYDDGETVTVRVKAQFINGSGADSMRASTVDIEVYEQDAGAVGSDICATSAQAFTMDDTYETFDFTVTPTGLVAGDLLNIVLTLSCVADDANPTQIQAGEVALLCDIRG